MPKICFVSFEQIAFSPRDAYVWFSLTLQLSKSGRKTRKDSDSDDENEKLKERIAMLEAERKDLGKKVEIHSSR